MSRGARHLQRRPPRKTRGFAWARLVDDEGVVYRLTRADESGRLHMEQRGFSKACERAVIARVVCTARNRLRDTVDEIVLRQLGLET